jgi:hypothetical protein
MALEEKDIIGKIRSSFLEEYSAKTEKNLTGVKKVFRRVRNIIADGGTGLLLCGAIALPIFGAFAMASFVAGTAVTAAPAVIMLVAAAGIWTTIGGIGYANTIVKKQTEAAIKRDTENGTLVNRYAQEVLTLTQADVTQETQLVAGLQKKFSVAVSPETAPAITAKIVPPAPPPMFPG